MDLKEAARRAGVRGRDISDRFAVDPGTASRWLTRKLDVPTKHVRDLADMLKVNPVDILPPRQNDPTA